MSQRKARVEHALRDVLTELIATEVRDPRVRAVSLLTVTKVELNVDMAVANVYVSVIGGRPAGARRAALDDDGTADGVIAGLQKAAGFLRGPVGRKLSLQHAPELRFHLDGTIDISDKLAAIVRDDEERARAVGREPEPRAGVPVRPVKPPTVFDGEGEAPVEAEEGAPAVVPAPAPPGDPARDPGDPA